MASGVGTGGALYGIARGFRDARRDANEEEAMQTDQQVRRAQLAREPLMQRLLSTQVGEAERQAIRRPQVEADEDTLRRLNVEAGGLDVDARKIAANKAREAEAKEKALNTAIGRFHTTGDPQHVADAVASLYPSETGAKPIAKRLPDGSIEISGGNMQPITFKTQTINGVQRSADDQFGQFAFRTLNPVESLRGEHAARVKADAEAEKQGLITQRSDSRETIRALARADEADRRRAEAEKKSNDRGKALTKRYVDSSLKTTSVPGNFTASYSSEDDAKLLPHIYTAAGAHVEAGHEPEVASQKAINDVRTHFLTQKKQVLEAATALRAAGIDPRDKAAMAKARADGNQDVTKLLEALGTVSEKYGADVGNYLLEQIPAKKK